MPHPKFSGEEITQRGKAIYRDRLRALVVTTRRLPAKQPDAAIWLERIGFNAVHAVGGTNARTMN